MPQLNKKTCAVLSATCVLGIHSLSLAQKPAPAEKTMTENIFWLGHDSFRIDGPKVIYFDPFKLAKNPPQADLILITHDHFDHCSPDDIKMIRGPHTVILGPKEIVAKLPAPVETLAPGEIKTFLGIEIRAVLAYNLNKKFHPKKDNKIGFLVKAGGKTYYHAGDTDHIPEMAGLAPDVAFLPVSGTYVMTAQEAANAALAIKPKVAIPMHYGSIVGSVNDAQEFKRLLSGSGIEVVIKNVK